MKHSSPALGLIAGDGRFPREIARAARERGRRVVAVAIRDLSDPALEAEVDECRWLYLGEIDALIRTFHDAGVGDAVLAGKVSKTLLYGDLKALRPDARALAWLAGLPDRGDRSILRAFAELLEGEGVRLCDQSVWVRELLPAAGPLGRVLPTEEQLADIAFAWPIAQALAELDVGQGVVVKQRAVLAVEAIDGTDATILRGAALGGAGVCVVKVASPLQDPRFDLPTIGLRTIEQLIEVAAGVFAFEALQTVVLDREEVVRRADANGLALLGVDPASLPQVSERDVPGAKR